MTPIKKVQAVVYAIKDGVPYFLVLHRVLHWSGWELVKGTMEDGESPEETITREVREETGLRRFAITGRLGKTIRFSSKGKEYEIVDVFVVKVERVAPVTLDQHEVEHDGYRWVTLDEALRLLTYENAREVLKTARSALPK